MHVPRARDSCTSYATETTDYLTVVIVPGSITGTGRLPQITADCRRLRLYNAEIVYNFKRYCLSSQAYIYPLCRTHASINWVANVVHSTYSTIFNSIRFMSISRLRANNGLLLVIASVGLLSPSIHLTLAIRVFYITSVGT